MRLTALLPALPALLPLASAFILPGPEDAFDFASSLINGDGNGSPDTVLSPASDVTLQSIGTEEFYVITSADHPNHKVRIKQTDGWCDPDVRSWTGYLDVHEDKSLFFYFFESRNKPKEDPVLMWINGGPGCSSSMGLFMELGPCSVADGEPKSANDTKVNPWSWNKEANVFFLDEPVGVGFSTYRHGQLVDTAEKAGQDVAAFIEIFFDTFKEFQGRDFHMAGESYGGRYLPVFASAVYDNNAKLIANKKEPVNLKSVMIGNGITSFYATTESYFDYQCTLNADLNHTVQDIGTCVELAESVPRCHKMTKKSCIDSHDYTACSIALDYCANAIQGSFFRAGVNPYDVSKKCSPQELSEFLCYPETKRINKYLDLPEVRKKLGVDKSVGDFQSCNPQVGAAFHYALDNTGQTWLYVAQLLERGVRVLNYAGTLDFICNHIGNEVWMEQLKWTGQKGYNEAKLKDWKVNDKVAGKYKTSGNLSLLKVYGAGHMVPTDQPENAYVMLKSWLDAGKIESE